MLLEVARRACDVVVQREQHDRLPARQLRQRHDGAPQVTHVLLILPYF